MISAGLSEGAVIGAGSQESYKQVQMSSRNPKAPSLDFLAVVPGVGILSNPFPPHWENHSISKAFILVNKGYQSRQLGD